MLEWVGDGFPGQEECDDSGLHISEGLTWERFTFTLCRKRDLYFYWKRLTGINRWKLQGDLCSFKGKYYHNYRFSKNGAPAFEAMGSPILIISKQRWYKSMITIIFFTITISSKLIAILWDRPTFNRWAN